MPTLMENIPEELRVLQRWVCANADSKRPMACFEDRAASVSKPGTWGDFDEARSAVEQGIYEYAGFVFDDDGYIGIDIDHAFGEDGLPTDEALAAVRACRSYTELSKSGSGFHIICKGSLPFKGRNNRAGWEIYREARFFVLTGRTVMFSEIAEAQEGIEFVLREHFAGTSVEAEHRQGGEVIWKPEWSVGSTLRCEYPTVMDGQGRHISLVSYCGQAKSWLAAPETVGRLALAANASRISPPLPETEVLRVAASCTRRERVHGRD